jgi:acyl-CoA synthetase (NDP forming)/GNAT superfamily N-acetyltransferase
VSNDPRPADTWTAHAVLADGSTVLVRPATSADRTGLEGFHARQSAESTYKRYFTARKSLSDGELDRLTTSDFTSAAVLLAVDGDAIVGVGCWFRLPGRADADVAFQVDDANQGRGLATLLLEHLAAAGIAAGIVRFTAETLGDNRAMLRVFSRAGWPVQRAFASGTIELVWPLADTELYLSSVEAREQLADSRAMARLLFPNAIAIVGATDREGTVGASITSAVLGSFTGPIHLVNPSRSTAYGRSCVKRVADITDAVDLALLVVPASSIVSAIDDCIARRVRGAVIYATLDEPAIDTIGLQALIAHARDNGLRIIGPASMGVIGRHPGREMQASLAPRLPRRGKLALSLQSGALGAAVLARTESLGVGLSWLVSLGDRSDVSGNDLLQFWDDDNETSVIGLYTERFGNPRKFARIARRVAMRRPIVAVESTGDAATAALYQQAGVIHVASVSELVDTARVLVDQPLPRSPVVAVVANAGSPLRLATSAIVAVGLTTRPVQLPWDATDEAFERSVQSCCSDPTVGAVLVIHAPPISAELNQRGAAIERGATGSPIPVLAVILGRDQGQAIDGGRVATFAFPDEPIAIIGRMWSLQQWRLTAPTETSERPAGYDELAAIASLEAASTDRPAALSLATLSALLRAAGIDHARTLTVNDRTVVGAQVAAAELCYPVALKVSGNRPLGRSARAGIALDLNDADALSDAFNTVLQAGGAEPIVVQQMLPPGLEVRVQIVHHDALGPVIAVGLGGQGAAAAGPPAMRLPPLTLFDAEAMIDEAGLAAVLNRFDIDVDRLLDLIVRVGHLAVDVGRLEQLDLDPLMVSSSRCAVADAFGRASDLRPDGPLRRLE